tara:strand:- start:5 stop:997 length:993 start_codon:yes stop_codon:yes gene_type:complete
MAYTTIDNPELYFQNKIYSGDGNDDRSITLDGSENMQPDIVWLAERNTTSGHAIHDSARGVDKFLFPYATNAEGTSTARVKSFDSDGFTVGTSGATNGGSDTYVAWCWKESVTAGMDIVKFTGNQTARTISHSLSAKPEWLWIKNREKVESYHMQHGGAGADNTQESNTNGAFGGGSTIWNDTEPTTSVFSVGNNGNINETGSDIVVWLWAGKQGYSKFGTYTGNGNADGPFIHLGFKPAFLMYKSRDAVKSWYINDNKRDPHNPCDGVMLMDASDAENASHGNKIDFLSNGFKSRSTGSTVNSSGAVYVYMAFSESPFVNSKGVPTNAR